MNMLNMQFDQAELNSAPSYELLPKGNYAAQIVNSEIKENRNGGNRLSLQWEIVDGQYAGRMVFQNININHSNPEVVRIGRQQIAQICAAIGRNAVNDSSELHNQPMQVRVIIKEDKTGQYEPSNEIRGYSALAHGQSQGFKQPVQSGGYGGAQQQSAPAPQAASAPWARK